MRGSSDVLVLLLENLEYIRFITCCIISSLIVATIKCEINRHNSYCARSNSNWRGEPEMRSCKLKNPNILKTNSYNHCAWAWSFTLALPCQPSSSPFSPYCCFWWSYSRHLLQMTLLHAKLPTHHPIWRCCNTRSSIGSCWDLFNSWTASLWKRWWEWVSKNDFRTWKLKLIFLYSIFESPFLVVFYDNDNLEVRELQCDQ